MRRRDCRRRMGLMDHDRLFKELLTTFFVEFIELFSRNLGRLPWTRSLEFLDKEGFNRRERTARRHEADIVAKARFLGKDLGS